MESAEFVALVLFKTLSGEKLPQTTWDRYIISCFWFPENLRTNCLNVLNDRENYNVLKDAQLKMIDFFNALMKGKL
jgi:hypothetical protein